MYKYVFKANTKFTIKTPKVNSIKDIKVHHTQSEDKIENHSIYPNGLDLFITQYDDEIEIISNKPIIEDENNTLKFED